MTERVDVVCLQEVTQAVLALFGDDTRIQQLYLISDDPRKHKSEGAPSYSAFRSRASTSPGFANVTLVRRDLALDDVPSFQSVTLPSEMGRHALMATLMIGGRRFTIANVHLDSNPARKDLRIEQLGRVEDALDAVSNASHGGFSKEGDVQIVCGDFNFTPQSDEEKAIPTCWGDTWGRGDVALRASAGDGSTTHYGRIDRVFVSPLGALTVIRAKRLGVGVTVDDAGIMPISDHNGLRVDLGF